MSSARRGFGQHSPGKLVCASMASNIYHPLPAFYFILVAVIWCSASVTRRYAPPPCSSPVPSTTKKSPDRMVWGCGGALSTAVEPLDEVFFKAIMIDAFLIHRTAAICCPCLDLIEGVSHGNACADCFQHFNVVSAIPKGNRFCF